MKKSLGIYVHIPFCLKKCRYCDFCSFGGKSEGYMAAYADELCRRIRTAAENADGYEVDTVYFGGGTPSLMPISEMEKIMGAIRGFDVKKDAEITLECNPATADRAYFEGLLSLGFNRLSIGLQSAVDRELELLGRAHDLSDFLSCFEDARSAGFDNISVDLMYGIPEQTEESFRKSLELVTSLSPEHISSYGLTVEEGTYFFAHRDELDIADGDGQASMYEILGEYLSSRGYEKYEISNFARKGRESRHNTRYWRRMDYLGFGVAAHSCFEDVRFGNSRDIDAFLRGEDICEERYELDLEERRREYIMLGLRLAEGIDRGEYRKSFGVCFPSVEKFINGGFMREQNGRVAFTEKGFLVSNAILSEFI